MLFRKRVHFQGKVETQFILPSHHTLISEPALGKTLPKEISVQLYLPDSIIHLIRSDKADPYHFINGMDKSYLKHLY
jgi:hypothetical protein